MDEFVPFHTFLERLRSTPAGVARANNARPAAAAGSDDPATAGGEPERLRSYLVAHYQGAQVVHSFLGDDGQYIDCIKVGTQPGLQGQEPLASPPEFAEMPGARPPVAQGVDPHLAGVRVDRFGNLMQCPAGAIPVRRVTLEELSRAGKLEKYFEKAPGGGALPPTGGGA